MKPITMMCVGTMACFFFQTVYSQEATMKNEFTVTGLLLSPNILTNIIVAPNWELVTTKSKNRLGFGLSFNYIKYIQEKRQDISFGPRINYHLVRDEKIDFYVGVGVHYSMRKYDADFNIITEKPDESKIAIRGQMGAKYYIGKHFGVVFELSNYSFKTGIIPTIGVNVHF